MTEQTFSRTENTDTIEAPAVAQNLPATNPLDAMFPAMPAPTGEQMQELAERMRNDLAKLSERLSGNTTPSIKVKGSVGFIPDENGAIEPFIKVVIVAWTSYNALFETQYSPGTFEAPKCYALNPIPENLAPASNALDPQAESCAACPKNQFKSAPNGRGKACRNARRTAVLLHRDGQTMDVAELKQMAIPPTSLKTFEKYVATLAARHSCSTTAVLTKISLDPNEAFAKLVFSVDRPLSPAETMIAYNWVTMGESVVAQQIDYQTDAS